MTQPPKLAVSADDILDAADRLSGQVRETPLLRHPWLDERARCEVVVKAETLQHTGSFKFRGAMNCLSRFTPQERARGVVAWSSGNHGQAVAAAAARFGIKAQVVMPSDAPQLKVRNTRRFGAEVVFYDRYTEVREDIAAALMKVSGAIGVSPNDNPQVVAGYGTVGLEMLRQAQAAGTPLDTLLVPCGGGGLVASIATIARVISPSTKVIAIEPVDFDDTKRSVASGERLRVDANARTICDALTAPMPAVVPFPMIQAHVSRIDTATDGEVREAMRVAYDLLKLVVEPGGAIGLAALLAGSTAVEGRVGVLLSGGNVDPALFAETLAGEVSQQAAA